MKTTVGIHWSQKKARGYKVSSNKERRAVKALILILKLKMIDCIGFHVSMIAIQ